MSQTLDYLFFNDSIRQQFTDFLLRQNLNYAQQTESVSGAYVVRVDEALVSGELWDQLDDFYDQLYVADQVLLEQSMSDIEGKHVAGIYVQLADGKHTVAKVAPDVINRMLTVITLDELNQLVEAIVQSVENPVQANLCQLA